MGVHGLWKLIEPAGKPIPLESLENKVLAVDVSIWLYQLTKGLQTTGGGSVANAHLLGLFNRICKLLYYRIKPVFVFDGGVPILKKETIEARKRLKRKAQDNSEQLREKLLNNLLKQNAVNQLLGNEDLPSTSAQVIDDMFTLPPLPEKEENDESDDESDTDVTTAKLESFCDSQYGKDLHSIDITSEQFKSLPAEIRHEILSELQETRKQNSWARVHEMPEQSQDFSKFQMERLRKRRNVQISLENAAKELGGRSMTLGELEAIFKEDGIVTDSLLSQRIVGDNVTRFIYVTGKSKEKQPADIPVQTEIVEESPKEKPAKKCKEFNESDFHKSIQTIEECIFINDSSSDEDLEIIEDPKNGDISQEDILKIIKREQNISDEQIEDESVEKISKIVETTSTPTINTGKSNDVDYVEATQTADVWKTSSILSLSVSLTQNNGSPGSSPKQCCSQLSNSNSYELFPDNAEETKSSVNLQPSLNREQELLKTLILEKSNESADSQEIRGSDSYPSSANRKEEFIKTLILEKSNDSAGEESLELFSESESDDGFVEVGTPNEPSLYFKESEKSVQISIQPVNEIEDDIFADVFDSLVSEEKISDEIKQVVRSDEKVEKSTKPVQLADIFDKVKNVENQLKLTFEKSKNNSPRKKKTPEKNEQLTDIQKMLNDEKNELLADYGKQERFGSTITQQMVVEAQELLQLFGLPYVIAPMEAEAQCAFLDQISLTEGTITDDSDIWLFGGQKVYKNFFDNRKYVLQFRAVDIEHFFKLSREQLIQMALLVGSDYTVGIEGIGPVTALEILAYFSDPSNKPQTKGDIAETLRKFRIWIKNSRNNSCPLSKKCRNVTLSEAFPSRSVIEAYLYPTVEESKEGFTWATPDLDRIRLYMKSKFGWKTSRIDDILLPVMRRLSNKNKQSTLDSYFKAKPFAPLDFGNVSKRVIQAINVMKSKTNEDFLPIPSTSKSPKKREIVLKTPKRETTKKSRGKKASSKASLKSMSPHKASYFGNIIPQKEKDKLEAAKRKCEAIKIFQAKNKTKRKAKKLKTLPAKPDSSYLSESSSDEN